MKSFVCATCFPEELLARSCARNLFNKKYNVNVPLSVIADPSQKCQPENRKRNAVLDRTNHAPDAGQIILDGFGLPLRLGELAAALLKFVGASQVKTATSKLGVRRCPSWNVIF